jgi:endoglucanase
MVTRLLGYLLVGAALVLVVGVWYRNSQKSQVPLVFSPTQLLDATWLNYKNNYLEAGTYRTVDSLRGNITTSEGQSYTLLRAVWEGDKQTFDGAWLWTQNNIAHHDDHLFSWLWGPLPDGRWGVLTSQNGQNSASDADTDIALSLLFAYARWQDPAYLFAARNIIRDIWDKEVVVIGSTPYLTADNIENASSSAAAAINPSYFNPAAYRLFAKVDPSHPWDAVLNSSYYLLNLSIESPLNNSHSAYLPPDWIEIDKTTGAISPLLQNMHDTYFGFDALRIPYRLSLDWEWFNDQRDKTLLREMSFLSSQWSTRGRLASVYAHDGSIVQNIESPAMYGATIGYFLIADPAEVKNVYQQKLLVLYDPGASTWKERLSYYDDNWAWFGIALYNHLLPNLTQNLPQQAFSQ